MKRPRLEISSPEAVVTPAVYSETAAAQEEMGAIIQIGAAVASMIKAHFARLTGQLFFAPVGQLPQFFLAGQQGFHREIAPDGGIDLLLNLPGYSVHGISQARILK